MSKFDAEAERAFVDAVLRNDPLHLEEFCRRIALIPRLVAIQNHRMGRRLTADEVDDVAGDCFLTVLRRLREYQPIAPLESWVSGICSLAVKGEIRKKDRHRPTTIDLDQLPHRVGPTALNQIADLGHFEQLLQGLNHLQASVLRLKCLAGLNFVELAARLSISPNTAKTLHYRAARQLRDRLRAEEEEDSP